MQTPPSLVLERNEDRFDISQQRLVIEPDACRQCSAIEASDILTFNYRTYEFFETLKPNGLLFGLDIMPERRYDEVVIFMPKSKDELEFFLDLSESVLKAEGTLLLVGEKKAGVASGAKRLQGRATDCSKIDSAKHCQLWESSGYSQRPSLLIGDYFNELKFEHQGRELTIAALPGVFSKGRIDEGTQFLLQQNLKRLKGRVLDFGCGAGVISAAIKSSQPELEVEGIDISWFALTSAKRTFELNQLEGEFYPSDGWNRVSGRVNAVVTNPPFHQGVATEYDTTEGFIKTAYSKMARYAPMYIVANNFLRYPDVIETVFGQCTYYAKSSKFNVYYCER